MREIHTHNVEGKGGGADNTGIAVLDEPGHGGACHHYKVTIPADVLTGDCVIAEGMNGRHHQTLLDVQFQNGPIQEFGVNGVQQEHLLAIVEDRLACFQAGPFANGYNQEALIAVRDALAALKRRTTDRVARKVEGYNQA